MDLFAWISPLLNVLAIVGFIAGLWVASRLLPALIDWIHTAYPTDLLYRPLSRTILWLAAGTLFSFPLLDLLNWVGNLANIALVPSSGNRYSTLLGSISLPLYLSFSLLLMLLVYGIILYLAVDFISRPGRFDRTQRILLVLTVASLVYQGVFRVIDMVFAFQLPILNVQQNYGVAGFLAEVLIGLVVLSAILIGLNRVIPKHPASNK
jgi:hypothetical protein